MLWLVQLPLSLRWCLIDVFYAGWLRSRASEERNIGARGWFLFRELFIDRFALIQHTPQGLWAACEHVLTCVSQRRPRHSILLATLLGHGLERALETAQNDGDYGHVSLRWCAELLESRHVALPSLRRREAAQFLRLLRSQNV